MFEALTRWPLRLAARGAHGVWRGWRRFMGARLFGAHAVAITPGGAIVLVRLRYASGWRLPGGGRAEAEDPRTAVLRELEEEIGMVSHGEVRAVREFEEKTRAASEEDSLFIVRDVEYQPRWSFEVEEIAEFPLDRLPEPLSEAARQWIEQARPLI
jgi:ADP-ribose pyrophosphatase YjhB (NUDIX family)